MVAIRRLVEGLLAESVAVCGGRLFGRTRHRRHDSTNPPFTPDFHRELTLVTRIIICLCDLETVREHGVVLVYLCTSELHAYGAFLDIVSRTQLTITEVFRCAHSRTIQTRRLLYCINLALPACALRCIEARVRGANFAASRRSCRRLPPIQKFNLPCILPTSLQLFLN